MRLILLVDAHDQLSTPARRREGGDDDGRPGRRPRERARGLGGACARRPRRSGWSWSPSWSTPRRALLSPELLPLFARSIEPLRPGCDARRAGTRATPTARRPRCRCSRPPLAAARARDGAACAGCYADDVVWLAAGGVAPRRRRGRRAPRRHRRARAELGEPQQQGAKRGAAVGGGRRRGGRDRGRGAPRAGSSSPPRRRPPDPAGLEAAEAGEALRPEARSAGRVEGAQAAAAAARRASTSSTARRALAELHRAAAGELGDELGEVRAGGRRPAPASASGCSSRASSRSSSSMPGRRRGVLDRGAARGRRPRSRPSGGSAPAGW